MSIQFPDYQPSPDEVAVLQRVHELWNGGSQPQAVEVLRPLADTENKPWAIALMAWLLMQQGYPSINQSVDYAIRASHNGMPWQAVQTFNHLLGQIPNAPQLVDRIPELLQAGLPWQPGIDPIGQSWNLINQGQYPMAIRLLSLNWTFPMAPSDWDPIVATARAHVAELEGLAISARGERERVSADANEATAAISKTKDELETAAKQAGLLVTATTSDATNALFKADAARNERESRISWYSGLVVLAVATIVAVLPLILHYCNVGPEYSTTALIGAHIASTLALATFAGVLLARARSRDLAAQRANDLSTAMGTMISYSNQIRDPHERERFMTTMGQLVLQAHLTIGSGHHPTDDSLSGLVVLANLLKPAPAASSQ